MWDKFTNSAQSAVHIAMERASKTGQSEVSPYQLLYGLASVAGSGAVKALNAVGANAEQIINQIDIHTPHSPNMDDAHVELGKESLSCVHRANEIKANFNSEQVRSEYLLLAILEASNSLAAHILKVLGVTEDRLKEEIVKLQSHDEDNVSSRDVPINTMKSTTALDMILSDSLKLRGTSLLSIADLSKEQFYGILQVASLMDSSKKSREAEFSWDYPRSLAMIFEKPSLRTRVTFDLGMRLLGGITTILGPAEIGLGSRESVPDVARNLERWVDAIMARVFEHKVLVELRDNCSIPIINGLSDLEHPCQVLADFYAIQRNKGKLEGLKLSWVGDGNNVLHSLMLAGVTVGMTISAAVPAGYGPDPNVVRQAREIAGRDDAIILTNDPSVAAEDADVVYTDVWTSMGQEKEMIARVQAFRSFQVNEDLMKLAAPKAVFMHCLPAHRGDEVTDGVLDGPQSIVFDQAEARLYAQQAILALTIGP